MASSSLPTLSLVNVNMLGSENNSRVGQSSRKLAQNIPGWAVSANDELRVLRKNGTGRTVGDGAGDFIGVLPDDLS